MVYIADIDYDGESILSLLYGKVEDESRFSMDTYSPSYINYFSFTGIEYYNKKWAKITNEQANVRDSGKFENEKEAQIVIIKLIFFEEEE